MDKATRLLEMSQDLYYRDYGKPVRQANRNLKSGDCPATLPSSRKSFLSVILRFLLQGIAPSPTRVAIQVNLLRIDTSFEVCDVTVECFDMINFCIYV